MDDKNDPLMASIPSVARRLGIAKGLAYRMAREGRLPSVLLGKRAVRVPLARLQAWIAEQTREETEPNVDAGTPDDAQ
jgi:excisionase family DNA binding protein